MDKLLCQFQMFENKFSFYCCGGGVISDKEIMQYCVLDLENYTHYLESLRPCVHDAGVIFTQQHIKIYCLFNKGKTLEHTIQILMNYFIPHR